MPRAKVKPQDRQRSVKACLACRRSKVKCDAGKPCTQCQKRGRHTTCKYEDDKAHSGPDSGVSIENHQDEPASVSPEAQLQRPAHDVPVGEESSGDLCEEEFPGPQSRMLLNSSWQEVYVGETASLSYLQYLREVVRRRIGDCAFTEGEFSNFMFEVEALDTGGHSLPILDSENNRALARHFLDATGGLLDVFPDNQLFESLNRLNNPAYSYEAASLYLALAIGAQSRGSAAQDLTNAANLFSHARRMAFEGLLCDPSPEMVRQFVLMAFYMLGACHRNGAFIYIGIAARTACALGWHTAVHYQRLSGYEYKTRSSIWKSLRVLDTIVNSILGRSGGLSGLKSDVRIPASFPDDAGLVPNIRGRALQASYDLCFLVDKVEHGDACQKPSAAESILQLLQVWCKSLPQDLRIRSRSFEDTRPVDRELAIAGANVACFYYFTVILTTRRFLLVRFSSKAAGHSSSSHRTREKKVLPLADRLADVCSGAAANLAKAGHHLMRSDCMPDNMCIMKAWMFAAGLTLGFPLFANGPDSEMEEAFSRTRSVLQSISIHSPQAKHYHGILGAFSEAITLYRRRLSIQRKRLNRHYMDEIFQDDHDMLELGSELLPPGATSSSTGTNGDEMTMESYDEHSRGSMSLSTSPNTGLVPHLWGIDLDVPLSYAQNSLLNPRGGNRLNWTEQIQSH